MSVVSLLLLIGGGFVVLLLTFAGVGKLGERSRTSVSIFLILSTIVSFAVGLLYDVTFWWVMQTLVTTIWFVFYPTDAIKGRGVLPPLILLFGVVVSVLSCGGVLTVAFIAGIASFQYSVIGGVVYFVGMFLYAASVVTVWRVARSRIKRQWTAAMTALKSMEVRQEP